MVAIVTGGARRIGSAICRRLHADGHQVVIHCNESIAEACDLATTLNILRPDSALVSRSDLGDAASHARLIEEAISNFGRIDVLVNNASVFYATHTETSSLDEWHALMNINLRAPVFLSLAAFAELKKSRGCIVNIVDIHAKHPMRNHLFYNISKTGLFGATRSLALEFAPHVRVNGVSPGANEWPEEDSATTQIDQIMRDRITQSIPLQRVGTPDEIAQATSYLATANYVTGQIVQVDGGRTLAVPE